MFLFNSLEKWNFVISVIALIVALYSVWYTRQRDKASVEIQYTTYTIKEYNPTQISFSILNCSNSPIKITNVELLNLDGSRVNVIYNHKFKFPPRKPQVDYFGLLTPTTLSVEDLQFTPFFQESVFKNPEIIFPNKWRDFRYYVNPFNNPLKIRITADRPIHRWSKRKTFLVHFVQSDN